MSTVCWWVTLFVASLGCRGGGVSQRVDAADPADSSATAHLEVQPQGRVSSLTIAGLRVQLESTTLRDVVRHLHAGQVHEKGDAGDYLAEVCFRLVATVATTVVFESSSMGGDEQRVTAFELREGGRSDAQCQQVPHAAGTVVADHGLRLGISLAELQRRMGPGRPVGQQFVYEGAVDTLMRAEPLSSDTARVRYQVSFGTEVRVEAGRIVGIRAWQVTTN